MFGLVHSLQLRHSSASSLLNSLFFPSETGHNNKAQRKENAGHLDGNAGCRTVD